MSNIIRKFVNKTLSLSRLGDKWFNKLVEGIIEAGRTRSYIETYTPTKSDLFHKEIKNSDKKHFMKQFEKFVRFSLSKLNVKNVKIAFDVTEDLTWSKRSVHTRASVYEHHLQSFSFLSVSIVEPYFIPLMSVPYTMFDSLDNLVIDLVEYVRSLPLKIDLALFDRGFYHAHLIDYLTKINMPYLIFVPKTKAIKRYCEETKSVKYFTHTMKHFKNKSPFYVQINIMIKKVNETFWCYSTNLKPCFQLMFEYKKRWNIETGFRIHDETGIKSKSSNLLIRFYYHLVGMLLILLWRLQCRIKHVVFKRYLKDVQLFYSRIDSVHPPPL